MGPIPLPAQERRGDEPLGYLCAGLWKVNGGGDGLGRYEAVWISDYIPMLTSGLFFAA